ncbi:uncharacterized protein N7498_009851 [Penicillium cinerascens]|uniref:DUF7703 domain-containing protein n=1 Tax=Penicillium cinerascens TaxID=70096 RepID=A0A9W9J7V9_9EURO|nr:uncharacterized protein N7498_009851 [Penicillium cinerascens]KAJ5190866.1 hypothetical protein N7498_009851 [Penicillium cinerascens]
MPNAPSQPADGDFGDYHGENLTIRTLMAVFLAIASYNAFELFILVFSSFSQYRGLYFWSLLLSVVLGVIPYAVGYLLDSFYLAPTWLSLTLATIGLYVMVPGQSVVLYSRLHLIVRNPKVLNFVLWLIILDAIVLLVPTTILVFSTVYVPTKPIIDGYNVIERMELAWFCTQEFVLTSIYIFETVKLIKIWPEREQRRIKIMYELLTINFVIILLDIALLALEYLGYYSLQTTLKSMVYSIKLKLEFGVLGKLVSLVQTHCSQPVIWS